MGSKHGHAHALMEHQWDHLRPLVGRTVDITWRPGMMAAMTSTWHERGHPWYRTVHGPHCMRCSECAYFRWWAEERPVTMAAAARRIAERHAEALERLAEA